VSLKASDWNLEGAFEFFFNQPPARPATDPRFLEELYLRYKDPYSDMILVDGVSAFCDDLQVIQQLLHSCTLFGAPTIHFYL
jgi:DCN1-like protein 1/2